MALKAKNPLQDSTADPTSSSGVMDTLGYAIFFVMVLAAGTVASFVWSRANQAIGRDTSGGATISVGAN
jgi:hypothetical protein